MTVSTTNARNVRDGNGVATSFVYDFVVLESSHLAVYKLVGVDLVLQTLNVDYTLTGVGNPSGGTVEFAVPPANVTPGTGSIVLQRVVPMTQATHYVANDAFPESTHELALDKLTMLIQQVADAQSLALQLPLNYTGDATTALTELLAAAEQTAIDAAAAAASAADAQASASAAAASAAALSVLQLINGLIKSDGAGNFSAATAGTDFVKPSVATSFAATQTPSSDTASISTTSSYAFNGAKQVREITLTNAITVTFGAPTGIIENAMYIFKLKAGDTSARTFAWNSAYKFPAATPKLTSGTITSGAKDIITFIGGPSNTLEYMGHQADER